MENQQSAINLPVLVLNQNYEPLNICRARRAVVLLYQGKAEMLENGSGLIHSANQIFSLPSVIRLLHLIKHARRQKKLTRFEVFHRDNYTCQYCGKVTRDLTLDHVLPRYRGGQHVWENIVSACISCNRHKAGRTPEEAGMKLKALPSRPQNIHSLDIPYHYLKTKSDWSKYLRQ